jgi:hypothetical protein
MRKNLFALPALAWSRHDRLIRMIKPIVLQGETE